MKGALCFFPSIFCLWTFHGTKSMGVLVSQNSSKLYVIYDVYIVYTTILNLDHWIKIKMVANWNDCKSLYILTISLHIYHWIDMEQLKILAQNYMSQKMPINSIII
jgi:hypothetical protein